MNRINDLTLWMWIASIALWGSGLAALANQAPAPWLAEGGTGGGAPHGDPIVRADPYFKADRAIAWQQEEARYLLLEGSVVIEIGSYGFRARRAVVRIDEQRRPGVVIRHLSMYLDHARPRRGNGRLGAEAKRLLVTASTTGNLMLTVDLLDSRDQTPDDELIVQADRRIERFRLAQAAKVRNLPGIEPIMTPQVKQLRQTRRKQADQASQTPPAVKKVVVADGTTPAAAQTHRARPDASPQRKPGRQSISIDQQKWAYQPGSPDTPDSSLNMLMLVGGVSVVFQDYDKQTAIHLSCQNAVIFIDKDADFTPGSRQFDPSAVRGIYLEDNVIVTNGVYTVRAPRVYFDPSTEKAVLLDAVFYTWDIKRKVPLYMRAQTLRQHSLSSWSAQNAVLTTSEFAEPHFSIAAELIAINMRPGSEADRSQVVHVSAQNLAPRIGDLPVGWFPDYEGDAAGVPLKSTTVGSDNNGPFVRTRWDMFGLVGANKPPGVELSGDIDYRGEHGPAVGFHLEYDKPDLFGRADSYLLFLDDGNDNIGGRRVRQDDEMRGYLRWQHRQTLLDNWELSLELAYVSDATFLEEFFRSEADEEKPYETSIYLKRQQDDEAITFLAQYDLNNFIPQTTMLQSPGYTVEKLPELGYYRIGASLFGNTTTYYSQTRLSRMRLRFGNDSPLDRGFSTKESLATFGLPNTIDFDFFPDLLGIPTNYVGRLDSRHEFQLPMEVGPVSVVPFVAGRGTFYDDSSAQFVFPDRDYRVWGIVGARMHTSFSKSYDDIENNLLGVHRLRHVGEPSVDFFISDSLKPATGLLIVYDPDVETFFDGYGARFGLRNTLQTQRGGPGRWRSVDWLVINTDFIFRSTEFDRTKQPARYFSYRPEFSSGGDHFYGDLAWMVSDTFAVSGDVTYSFESESTAQWHAAAAIDHTPYLASFIEFEQINAVESSLLSVGLKYRLTRKYVLAYRQRWDLDNGTSRRSELALERKLPRWTMMLIAAIDDLDNSTFVGISLIPDGIRSSRRLGRFGR